MFRKYAFRKSAPPRRMILPALTLLAAVTLAAPGFAAVAPTVLPRHKPVAQTAPEPKQPPIVIPPAPLPPAQQADKDAARKLGAAKKAPPKNQTVKNQPVKNQTVKKADEKPARPAPAFGQRSRTAGMTPGGAPAASAMSDGETLAVTDTAEDALPDYPAGARTAIGRMQTYVTGEEDTFIDIARNYNLGYVELRAANPDIDPWSPMPGTTVVIPSFRLLPRATQDGIVVNLGEMRLYYFEQPGASPVTHPLGIGHEGLRTPTGQTTVIRKVAGPIWYPTARMRKEKPWLPAAVPAGPSNPLGTHALYLGFPEIRIHGSNKPWGIGRQVSSGCMRMYPEDIVSMFGIVPVGTHVTVVDQPVLVAWVDHTLYLEANPSKIQSNEIEVDGAHATQRPLTAGMKQTILRTAGDAAKNIDWDAVAKTIRERRGYPVPIATEDGAKPRAKDAAKKPAAIAPSSRFSYN